MLPPRWLGTWLPWWEQHCLGPLTGAIFSLQAGDLHLRLREPGLPALWRHHHLALCWQLREERGHRSPLLLHLDLYRLLRHHLPVIRVRVVAV